MPYFQDYSETTAPAGSDILLIDTATTPRNTRKLSIANLLKRGTVNKVPKFSASTGLTDSGLLESADGARLMYNLSSPIMTGGTGMFWPAGDPNAGLPRFDRPAAFSVNGPIAASAGQNEHYFENNWQDQNTMSIRNLYVGNGSFSNLRVLERGGWEMGSFGYGNTASTATETASYPWYESLYLETGNPNPNLIMKDAAGNSFHQFAPAPLRFIQSGVIPSGWLGETGYFYVRQEFAPNGDINFYDVSQEFKYHTPAVRIKVNGQLQVMPSLSDDAMSVQNRNSAGLATMKFFTASGRSAGVFGYGNAGSPASDIADTMYLLCDAGSTSDPAPAFKLMQIGNATGGDFFKTRFAMLANGRIVQAALPGVPANSELAQDKQVAFYLDETTNKLMVKVRYNSTTFKSGEVAALS